jgi:beta-galactosidase
MMRRDRNHPSVILWSVGNEVGEQYTGADGAKIARELVAIAKDEDPTRPTTTAMNFAKADMPLPAEVDVIGLNYQATAFAPAIPGADVPRPLPRQDDPQHRKRRGAQQPGRLPVPGRGQQQRPGATRHRRRSQDDARSAPTSSTPDFGASADRTFAAHDQNPYHRRRVRLDGLGLSGRADALLRIRAVPISGSSTWPGSRRTASTSIRRAGGPTCRWRISCRTGPGRSARAR